VTRLRSALWLPLFDDLADPLVAARLAGEAEQAGWDGFFGRLAADGPASGAVHVCGYLALVPVTGRRRPRRLEHHDHPAGPARYARSHGRQ
jgi:hypothetical protein